MWVLDCMSLIDLIVTLGLLESKTCKTMQGCQMLQKMHRGPETQNQESLLTRNRKPSVVLISCLSFVLISIFSFPSFFVMICLLFTHIHPSALYWKEEQCYCRVLYKTHTHTPVLSNYVILFIYSFFAVNPAPQIKHTPFILPQISSSPGIKAG